MFSIPPLYRTILYYVLAVANAVVVAGFIPDARYGSLIVGLAGIFGFTLAAQHVPTPPDATTTARRDGPSVEASESSECRSENKKRRSLSISVLRPRSGRQPLYIDDTSELMDARGRVARALDR